MYEITNYKNEYSKQDIVSLLKISDKESLDKLYKIANKVREENVGNTVYIRGIIEFSNYCERNCLYCGIRRSNEKVTRYRLSEDDILKTAIKAYKDGYKSIILQSGEEPENTIDSITSIITAIKSETDLKLTLALGERPEIEYRMMKEAGADRYLLKHETSDPILYRQLHPDLKYSNRIKSLRALKQLGFEVGSGIMVGLPGQTLESLANDILLFKSLDIDMIVIGPYIPHSDTPLARKFNQAGGYFIPAIGYFELEEMVYKLIAITRVVTKKTNIPTTGALLTINGKDGFEKALKAGVNVAMVNLIDYNYKKNYEIFPQKNKDKVKDVDLRSTLESQILNTGREPL